MHSSNCAQLFLSIPSLYARNATDCVARDIVEYSYVRVARKDWKWMSMFWGVHSTFDKRAALGNYQVHGFDCTSCTSEALHHLKRGTMV